MYGNAPRRSFSDVNAMSDKHAFYPLIVFLKIRPSGPYRYVSCLCMSAKPDISTIEKILRVSGCPKSRAPFNIGLVYFCVFANLNEKHYTLTLKRHKNRTVCHYGCEN